MFCVLILSIQFSQGRQNQEAAIVIFGVTSILAGILTLFLPETLGKKLPDTLEEGLAFYYLFHNSDSFLNGL